jgi:hypothetical protein
MNLRFTIYDLRLALAKGRRAGIFSNRQLAIGNWQLFKSPFSPDISE